jgi:hypothetical protein
MHRLLELTGFKVLYTKKHFRTIDLFNTVTPGKKERIVAFFFSRLFVVLGLGGGMVIEAVAVE